MAIQQINNGTEALLGKDGDTFRSAANKINENFTTAEHAASRLVGVDNDQIPAAQEAFKAANSRIEAYVPGTAGIDCNDLEFGTRKLISSGGNLNTPDGDSFFLIDTIYNYTTETKLQIAYGYTQPIQLIRLLKNGNWTAWSTSTTNLSTYNTTTASSPNVVVTSTGELQRSTSSTRFKKKVQPLVMDEKMYEEFLQFVPIFYQSTAEADNPEYWYQSFDADAVGAKHPSLAGWEDTETVLNEETGEYEERKLEKRRAIGLNLNGIVAVMQAGNLYQSKLIQDLQERVDALEAKQGA